MRPVGILFCIGLFCAAAVSVAAQTPAQPTEIRGGLVNGKAVSLPKPEYPAEARAAKLEGPVVVDVTIDEAGVVIAAKAADQPRKLTMRRGSEKELSEVPPADPILREAAEKAAMEARFSPTLLRGQAVKVSGYLVYNFVADDKRISGGVLNGKVGSGSLPVPEYPPAAAAVRAEGTVNVRVTVDERGNVISAEAVSGHPLLRNAAVEAARGAKFNPTLLQGEPVKVTGVIVYKFSAPDTDPM